MNIKFYYILSIFSYTSLLAQQQEIIWEKSVGGANAEYLYNAIKTPDYGFLILGSSASNSSGDIQKENQGNLDYFLWKMDENGKQEWENTFGGDGNDLLYAGKPTSDGGYILAGSSNSSKSGDKLSNNLGAEDIWVLKIDSFGQLQWQQTFGGNGNDIPVDVIRTNDGGYLIASNSNSSITESANIESFGSNDIYLVKLTDKGEIAWEKRFGGDYDDVVKSLIEIEDGFIVIGNSNSQLSGNKTIDHNGNHLWINHLDNKGNSINQYNLDIEYDNRLISFQNVEDQYLFTIQELIDQNKKTSLIYTDKNFNRLNKIEIELDNNLSLNEIQLHNSNYLAVANELSTLKKTTERDNIESYYITKLFDKYGKEIFSKKIGSKGFNYLNNVITTRDGSVILFGNSTQQGKGNKGQSDFYIVKLANKEGEIKRVYVEAYPNPTSDVINVLINTDFEKANIEVYNFVGQHLQTKEVKYRSTPISLNNYPSGSYILKINYNNQTESIKFIKK